MVVLALLLLLRIHWGAIVAIDIVIIILPLLVITRHWLLHKLYRLSAVVVVVMMLLVMLRLMVTPLLVSLSIIITIIIIYGFKRGIIVETECF